VLSSTVCLLSRTDLREHFLFSIWLGQGDLGGQICFYFFVDLVWFPIGGSCVSLSLIGDHT
jgi:hypothetical protein